MNKHMDSAALVLVLAAFFSTAAPAAEDVALTKDLKTVITLLGMPCDEVVAVIGQGENDNIAICKDGNRYRVYLNAEGRVVAEKK